jgi:hypothetical protein
VGVPLAPRAFARQVVGKIRIDRLTRHERRIARVRAGAPRP